MNWAVGRRAHADRVAGPEHQKLTRAERVTRYVYFSRDRVKRALLIGGVYRQLRPRRETHVGI